MNWEFIYLIYEFIFIYYYYYSYYKLIKIHPSINFHSNINFHSPIKIHPIYFYPIYFIFNSIQLFIQTNLIQSKTLVHPGTAEVLTVRIDGRPATSFGDKLRASTALLRQQCRFSLPCRCFAANRDVQWSSKTVFYKSMDLAAFRAWLLGRDDTLIQTQTETRFRRSAKVLPFSQFHVLQVTPSVQDSEATTWNEENA